MLEMNARNYYRETIESTLGPMGVSGKRLAALTEQIIGGLSALKARHPTMRSIRLPDNFFDFARSIRVIARQEATKPEQILTNLEKHVNDLFEIHELYPNIKGTVAPSEKQNKTAKPGDLRTKPMPENEVLIAAYKHYKTANGKAPPLSSREGLPEGSPTWGTIGIKLREQSGLTIRALVSASERPETNKDASSTVLERPQGKYKARVSDEEIIRLALEIKQKTGRLPTMSSAHEGLPAGTVGWKTIIVDLASRDLTIGKLIKARAKKESVAVNAPAQNLSKEKPTSPPQETPPPVITTEPPKPIAQTAERSLVFSVQAERVFIDCARLIKKNRNLPTVPNFYDFIGGKSVPDLNNAFKTGTVGGWERFTSEKPNCLQSFLLSVGMAETKDGQVRAASAHRIREIERAHGL